MNTLLLQKRSKSSDDANDRNILQKFTNKPCPKVDEWLSLIAKKNAMSNVWKFFSCGELNKTRWKVSARKKLVALEAKELGCRNMCGDVLGCKGGTTSNLRNNLKNNHSLDLSSTTTQQRGTIKQQSSIDFHMSPKSTPS